LPDYPAGFFILPDIQPNHPAGFFILLDIRPDLAGTGHPASGIRQEILDPAKPYFILFMI